MEYKFIRSGLLAGLLAGIAAYIFARIVLEPLVRKGIDYQEQRSHAESALTGEHGHEHEVFSRSVQENIGAGVGSIVFGLVMGALFAVAFTVVWAYVGRRHRGADPRLAAALLAATGFVAVYLVPFAAYPANPPGVGNDETIGERTGAYLTITLLSVGFAIAAAVIGLWLVGKLGGLLAAISAGAFYVVAVAISIAVLPSYNDVPTALTDGDEILFDGFPAATLADFRFYSVINQVVLWTVLGIVFTLALTRIARRASISTPESALVS
ncbi:CbtA family protein [Williamsia sp. 1135]|uniref:CbtA family protein n=1 Tax=Williamsia sp. 1135 TaxID=1889262 RepID=UPI000A114F15|nr:CbtA family protein [Williamsia sp. 1135]ORM37539.1 hypothetical protein BFL43_03860 [Williamsia sp. 1135]